MGQIFQIGMWVVSIINDMYYFKFIANNLFAALLIGSKHKL